MGRSGWRSHQPSPKNELIGGGRWRTPRWCCFLPPPPKLALLSSSSQRHNLLANMPTSPYFASPPLPPPSQKQKQPWLNPSPPQSPPLPLPLPAVLPPPLPPNSLSSPWTTQQQRDRKQRSEDVTKNNQKKKSILIIVLRALPRSGKISLRPAVLPPLRLPLPGLLPPSPPITPLYDKCSNPSRTPEIGPTSTVRDRTPTPAVTPSPSKRLQPHPSPN